MLTPFQRSTFAAILFVGLVSLPMAGCGGSGAPAAGPPGGGRPAGSLVSVMPVTQEQVTPTTTVVGTVIARRTSLVSSGADGKVDQFLVRVGSIVEEGDELSILNMVTTNLELEEARSVLAEREQAYLALKNGSRPEEIAESAARLEAARFSMDIAAKKLDRTRRLVATGAANQDALDDALEREEAVRREFEAMRAAHNLVVQGPRAEDVAAAQARYEAQQQHVAYLEAEKGKRTTKAPFRGIIVAEHTESGQWLSKNADVVTIADLLDEVHVVTNLNEKDLVNVLPGADAVVTFESTPGRKWQGKVLTIIPRTAWESGSRTIPVKVAVKNELIDTGNGPRPVLSEGMYARVTFQGQPRTATLVPKNAIILSESGSKAFVVLPGEKPGTGKAKPVMLKRGDEFGDKVEVLTEEIAPGMNVVTEGQERLTPFADVIIVNQSGSAAPANTPPAAAD